MKPSKSHSAQVYAWALTHAAIGATVSHLFGHWAYAAVLGVFAFLAWVVAVSIFIGEDAA